MDTMSEFRYFSKMMFRFSTLFGQQKVAAVFDIAPEARREMAASWDAYLQETDPAVLRAALRSLADDPPQWPPALAEFIQLCKQFSRPEHRPALPPPKHEPTEVGRQIQAEIASSISKTGFDYLAWAKFPGSEKAVELLVRGAREDRRLADILTHHLETDGRDCKNDGARKAIRGVPAHLRGQLARS